MNPSSPSGCTVRSFRSPGTDEPQPAASRAGVRRGIRITRLHRRIVGSIDLAVACLVTTIMTALDGGAGSRGASRPAPAPRASGPVRCTVTIRTHRNGPSAGPEAPDRPKRLRVRRVRSQAVRTAIGRDADAAVPTIPTRGTCLSEAMESAERHLPV